MAWISVYESIDGPKLRNLYKKLKCSKFEAVGILNFLWFWGLENVEKDGLILCADQEDIERYLYGVGAGCTISPQTILDALVTTGWIDKTPNGLYIHDWDVWQEQWYKAKERREKDAQRKRSDRKPRPTLPKHEETPKKQDSPQDIPEDRREEIPAVIPHAETAKHDSGQTGEDKTNNHQGEAKAEPAKYTPEFEAFWMAYPRKIDKGNAYKKFKARQNDGYSGKELCLAARYYAEDCKKKKTEPQFIKHPKTFLSDTTPFLDYLPKDEKTEIGSSPGTGNPFEEYGESEDR